MRTRLILWLRSFALIDAVISSCTAAILWMGSSTGIIVSLSKSQLCQRAARHWGLRASLLAAKQRYGAASVLLV